MWTRTRVANLGEFSPKIQFWGFWGHKSLLLGEFQKPVMKESFMSFFVKIKFHMTNV
jgi:hypothetical protein